MITLHEVTQGTDEWKELRADLYTGSNADKLLKFSTSTKIVDGVSSSYSLTDITGFSGNFHTRRGHVLEDEAIELYQQIKGLTGYRFPSGEKVGFVTNSEYPTCGYSPDDLYPDRTLEVKAFEEAKHLKMFNGEIPLKVLAQIHFGMLICEVPLCDLLIYNPRFAKKQDEWGIPNPLYDPRKALKIITIKSIKNISNNFKRILIRKEVTV